jgi:hypothetical protein
MWWTRSSDRITSSRAVSPVSLLPIRRSLHHLPYLLNVSPSRLYTLYPGHRRTSALRFITDVRYIRNGNPYKILGTIALLAPMIGAFVASLWTPNWSTWSYYATVLPMTFGYSVFLCCQLGMLHWFPIRQGGPDCSCSSFWGG